MNNEYITKAEYEFNMIKYNFVAVIICVSIAIVAWFSMYNHIVYSYLGAAVYMVNILLLVSNIIAMISHILNSMKYMIQKKRVLKNGESNVGHIIDRKKFYKNKGKYCVLTVSVGDAIPKIITSTVYIDADWYAVEYCDVYRCKNEYILDDFR
ncbi:hypothetical protein [Ruminococcus albus]|uniref:Uncharacterized protein n=1 Tax=Ruminococcus albus TaxID=1264 RepID=A0A1I1FBC1_RUMAL|nr:hypothetical protein [Ruminococcus albus]SFB96262.1 hypothetical protein SAMN02910406_00917 [Ruminococcus albus]